MLCLSDGAKLICGMHTLEAAFYLCSFAFYSMQRSRMNFMWFLFQTLPVPLGIPPRSSGLAVPQTFLLIEKSNFLYEVLKERTLNLIIVEKQHRIINLIFTTSRMRLAYNTVSRFVIFPPSAFCYQYIVRLVNIRKYTGGLRKIEIRYRSSLSSTPLGVFNYQYHNRLGGLQKNLDFQI